ncbi:MAG: DUF4129 domain-containing protein [Acidobacteria bacterium]|nr:DUF4129 domain-containing protein [Acidobacteriota bacterium]
MRRKIRLAGALFIPFLLIASGAASDAAPDSKTLSLSEYQQELSRVDKGLKALPERPEGAEALRESIPQAWDVATSARTFHIDNQVLRADLESYTNEKEDRGDILPEMELAVEAELDGANQFAVAANDSARSQLERILSGREYRSLSRIQSPLETLKERLLLAFVRFFSKLFRLAGAHPKVSLIFLWSTIGAIVLGFAIWIYLLLRSSRTRAAYSYPREAGEMFPSARPWQQWLLDAKHAADRGQWRDAVHLAYWCGISYLESAGAWKPDRARTPREYLRVLHQSKDAFARKEPLEALTRSFERVWYAQQAASAEDFQLSLAQLEKIGCR